MTQDKMSRAASDARWHRDRDERGWGLPPKAPWPFRLPIIRHLRFAWETWQVERHTAAWASVGIGIGGPSEYDRWVLYAIYRGWC